MRFASINTPSGLRLHVRGRSGYVDVAEATGQDQYATIQGLLNAGPAGLEAAQSAAAADGREYSEADFGPSVPAPRVVLVSGPAVQVFLREARVTATWVVRPPRGSSTAWA